MNPLLLDARLRLAGYRGFPGTNPFTASQSFSQRLYEEAAKESSAAPGGEVPADEANDDEVVDAEIVDNEG